MTIEITQTCNHCQKIRILQYSTEKVFPQDLETLGKAMGWCQVKPDTHLCARCINELLK